MKSLNNRKKRLEIPIVRSSHPRLLRKGVLKNFLKFTGKHLPKNKNDWPNQHDLFKNFFLYFGLYQKHLRRIKLSTENIILFSVDGFDINRNIRKCLNKSCWFDQLFWFFGQNTYPRVSFSIKIQACNFIKKILRHNCCPVNFAKFLRTPFLQNTSAQLLLNKVIPNFFCKVILLQTFILIWYYCLILIWYYCLHGFNSFHIFTSFISMHWNKGDLQSRK